MNADMSGELAMALEAANNDDGPVGAIIGPHREALAALCRQFGVRQLDLFGSATQRHFDAATSDLDFIADFADADKPGYALRYLRFAEALEALFHRPVDLLTERMIGHTTFRTTLEQTRRQIYEQRSAHAAS